MPKEETASVVPAGARRSVGRAPKAGKRKPEVFINLTHTHYDIVRECAEKRGWVVCSDEDGKPWNLFWTDLSVLPDRVMRLLPYQKINHFPGTRNIARKNLMGTHLNLFQGLFPQEYDFYPRTWVLPNERHELEKHFVDGVSPDVIICKPDTGCQGKGIVLTRKLEKIDFSESQIAQIYIDRPLLLNGYKFDLRIYVLVYSSDPLRLYLFKDGLVRCCSRPYDKSSLKHLGNAHIHLTNYAVNKDDEGFDLPTDIPDMGRGTKRSLQWLAKYFASKGLSYASFWERMRRVITKTLLTIQPILSHTYHTCLPSDTSGSKCFEILGFDILVDEALKPWLMEVNHSPSFVCDSDLDHFVKERVIDIVMDFANISIYDRQRYLKMEQEESQRRLYGSGGSVRTGGEARSKIDDRDEARRTELESIHRDSIELLYPPQDASLQALYVRILEAAETVHGMAGERPPTPRPSGSSSGGGAGGGVSSRCTTPQSTPSPSPRDLPFQKVNPARGTPRVERAVTGKARFSPAHETCPEERSSPAPAPLKPSGPAISLSAPLVPASAPRPSSLSPAGEISATLRDLEARMARLGPSGASQEALPREDAAGVGVGASPPPLASSSVIPPRADAPSPVRGGERGRGTPIRFSPAKSSVAESPERGSASEESEGRAARVSGPLVTRRVEDYFQSPDAALMATEIDTTDRRDSSYLCDEEEVAVDIPRMND